MKHVFKAFDRDCQIALCKALKFISNHISTMAFERSFSAFILEIMVCKSSVIQISNQVSTRRLFIEHFMLVTWFGAEDTQHGRQTQALFSWSLYSGMFLFCLLIYKDAKPLSANT